MITGRYDIQIGDSKFQLARDVDGHYKWLPQKLFVDRQDVSGRPGAQNIRPDELPWNLDDWSGGEGNKIHSSGDPAVFYYGACNPRIPGNLLAPPARTENVLTETTVDTGNIALLTTSQNRIYLFGDQNGWFSEDSGQSWNDFTTNVTGSYAISSVTGDHKYAYYAAFNDNTGIRRIYRKTAGSGPVQFSQDEGPTVTVPYIALAYLDGFVYSLAGGGNLARWDTSAGTPVPIDTVGHARINFDQDETIGGMCATSNSIFVFASTEGKTTVWEYDPYNTATGTFVSVWSPPKGFRARAIDYSNGVVFLAGDFGDKVAVYGYSKKSQQELFVGYIRYFNATFNPVWVKGSLGAQVMIGMSDNSVFIYDSDKDAFSYLDKPDLTNNTAGDGETFGNTRLAAYYNLNDTQLTVEAWNSDENTDPAGSIEAISGVWDFDLPGITKVLSVVDIATDPLPTDATVRVSYQVDEDGTWHDLTDHGDDLGTTFHEQVSTGTNTVSFDRLRLKVTGTNAPTIASVATRSRVLEYVERIQLIIRLVDDNPQERPASRQNNAAKTRELIRDIIRNQQVVTLKDGAYDQRPGVFTEYSVILTEPDDTVHSPTEGTITVIAEVLA